MRTLDFLTLDVFTRTPFEGNPLAVFLDAGDLPDARMQAIAREMNLSETVFLSPLPNHRLPGRSMRIFTPATELPFAGHPTVGTAVALAAYIDDPATHGREALLLQTRSGLAPVRVIYAPSGPQAVVAVPLRPQRGEAVDAHLVAAVLGLAHEQLLDCPAPCVGGAGVPFTYVGLRDRAALAAARIDSAAWERLRHSGAAPELYLYSFDADADEGADLRTRMFAPAFGIGEDPATGSAAAGLSQILVDLRAPADGTATWIIRQGVEMGRPSTIRLEADVAQGRVVMVRLGGSATLVSRGRLLLP
jgi:trans-2,3-dihydro-3-hydroxyanthranilate isomerase